MTPRPRPSATRPTGGHQDPSPATRVAAGHQEVHQLGHQADHLVMSTGALSSIQDVMQVMHRCAAEVWWSIDLVNGESMLSTSACVFSEFDHIWSFGQLSIYIRGRVRSTIFRMNHGMNRRVKRVKKVEVKKVEVSESSGEKLSELDHSLDDCFNL